MPSSLQEQLGLSSTELEILLRLIAHGQVAREQVCGITVSGHRQLKPSSVSAITVGLRRKLAKHGLTLATVHGFGWALSQKDRNWIVGRVAKDLGIDRHTAAKYGQ